MFVAATRLGQWKPAERGMPESEKGGSRQSRKEETNGEEIKGGMSWRKLAQEKADNGINYTWLSANILLVRGGLPWLLGLWSLETPLGRGAERIIEKAAVSSYPLQGVRRRSCRSGLILV